MECFEPLYGYSFNEGYQQGYKAKVIQEWFSSPNRGGGLVVSVREISLLFFDDAKGKEVFLPISTIMDWWVTIGGTKRGLRLIDLELDDEITVVYPAG